MIIYQGIQLVYSHVIQLLNGVSEWFAQVNWSPFVDYLPLNFQPFVAGFLLVLVAMACVGLVKKLSFLLG